MSIKEAKIIKVEVQQIKKHISKGVAGSVVGIITSICTTPFDVVKTRMQAEKSEEVKLKKKMGTFEKMKEIYKEEGLGALWKGTTSTILGMSTNWAFYFAFYDRIKFSLSNFLGGYLNNTTVNFLASMASGTISLLAGNPFWVAKNRIQYQSKLIEETPKYTNTIQTLCKIYQEEGPHGLYKGFSASIFGLIHIGIQFPLYEKFKQELIKLKTRKLISKGEKFANLKNKIVLSSFEIFLASVASKIIASTIAYPHEVLRTKLQIDRRRKESYEGIWPTMKRIYNENGFKGFYYGLGVNLLKNIPSNGISFTVYELLNRYLIK
ncbi:nicotinamide adenine dinucleotide transporter 1-related [Anaeramoeba ignava]|uniref:Nicotinamide adenine dinucleotide transporter 1-related n=1 Tax=Anaeramoeba ignava TaxID=1746090 RepID=A0A9Q0RDJ1_ANAIG|nr:nicotinamide adenine dinucleotide transporter 1-related [Anaeramoeba ignava]